MNSTVALLPMITFLLIESTQSKVLQITFKSWISMTLPVTAYCPFSNHTSLQNRMYVFQKFTNQNNQQDIKEKKKVIIKIILE